jgi:cell division protein FtsQ
MDRGRRLSQPLIPRRRPAGSPERSPPSRLALFLRRALVRLSDQPILHKAEFAVLVALFAATGTYGAVRGGHSDAFLAYLYEAGDALANSAGFGIANIEIQGAHHVARAEVLRWAGVTAHSSLLLLDADDARTRLKRNPWIAEATVRKLYPGRIEIAIEEREAFALWQRGGRFHLIARDGSVLESGIEMQSDLPLVVGNGAEKRAAAFVDLIARFPAIRAETRAGVLIAERRWNLRLKNGTDVRLPENDPATALGRLAALDREQRILSRDATMIDLRVPDRVAIGLSDEAAAARAAQRKQLPKRKGADT